MAKIKLTFTEEQLAVISTLRFEPIHINHFKAEQQRDILAIVKRFDLDNPELSDPDTMLLRDNLENISHLSRKDLIEAKIDDGRYWGVDTYELLTVDTNWYTAMALLTGDSIKHNGFDFDTYPTECLEKYEEMRQFLYDNMTYIGQLVFQRANKGGLLPNVTYVCIDREGLWYTEEEFATRH